MPGEPSATGGCSYILIALASGAAGAINMWYDRDIDAVMNGRVNGLFPQAVSNSGSLTFGVILSAFAVMMMFLATNAVAAGLLAARFCSTYSFIRCG